MIDVCICTHNPRRDILLLVLNSLAQQSVARGVFHVLVIDNASNPRLSEEIFAPLRDVGIEARVVFEPVPGLQRARLRGIEETSGEWILWVDDDNELSPNYIAEGLDFTRQHPDVGCLGGKLVLPAKLSPKAWVLPFLPFLGIKDAGENIIIQKADEWGPWEPAGAGSWVHRRVLIEYCRHASEGKGFFRLGRSGTSNLASCDDSFLMRGAFRVDMACAYVPQLQLMHHLSLNRFTFKYLMKIMRAYGSSHIVLESILRGQQPVPNYYKNAGSFLKLLLWVFGSERKKSLAFAIGQIAYHLGARSEHLKQEQLLKVIESNG